MHLKDELDDDFKRRQWRAQRVGWAILLAIVVAATLGLFGTSPLAGKVVATEQDGARYEAEYSRFTRYQHMDRLHLRVHAPEASGDTLRVAFSNDFVENVMIASSFPEADGGGATAEGALFEFKVDDWSQPIVLTFEYEPRKAFWSPGTVTIAAGDAAPVQLPLTTWVYP